MSQSSHLSIRHLGAADVGLLKGVLAMFGDAFDDKQTYTGAIPGQDYLRRLLCDDHIIALAALQHDAVIGGLAAYVLEKFEQERSEIYIYDLAVAEKHRRRGVASELIGRLKDIAKTRGAYVIYVQADLADGPAIALYTKVGIREDVLHFDIAIE
jgi:aminoglycoside 3-N-acetyltransferase I